MGIVKKQAIAGTIFTYIGVAIGFITSALIFPEFLTTEEIGLLSIFLSYSYILAQLATLGTGRITIFMFPYFKDKEKGHHGFFLLLTIIAFIGLLIAFLGFYFLKQYLVQSASESSRLFSDNINYIYPLTLFTLLFLVFDSFNTTLFNAIRGIILKEFLQRLFILVFILFYIFKWITFREYLPFYVLATAIPAILIMVAVFKNKDFSFRPSPSPLLKEKWKLMTSLGFYGILIGSSGMVITNLDRIMVERLMGLGSAGVYSTMAFFATMIIIPSRALLKISDPVIAQSWKNSDIENVRQNYYNSTLNQFLLGSFILCGIWINIDNILRILPPTFADGKFVVLLVGFAFLIDMLSGTATFILANSQYYKYQTYYTMLLVLLIIGTNYLFIPWWGLTGAALSTLVAKFFLNLVRHQLIYRKFNLQPYNAKFLVIILISVAAYLSGYFIPQFDNIIVDLIIRSAVISIVFIGLALALKISPDVNERYTWLIGKILKK